MGAELASGVRVASGLVAGMVGGAGGIVLGAVPGRHAVAKVVSDLARAVCGIAPPTLHAMGKILSPNKPTRNTGRVYARC